MEIAIKENEPLAQHTTFRIGGPAKFFVDVLDENQINEALQFARAKDLKCFILGGGSNVLFSDDGFSGLVIRMQNQQYEIKGTNMVCGSGMPLSMAVSLAAKDSLSGLEWAAGIPGTVGGAVRGNAGALGSTMAKIVDDLRVLDVEKKEITSYANESCQFSYRSSIFKKNPQLVIISANIRLEKGDQESIKKIMTENIERRVASQSVGQSAGSFFENPVVEDKELIALYEKDTGNSSQGGTIPAGWLIDEMGFRGKKIGGVMVSEKHANFIINLGNGTANDVIILAGIIKQKARKEFGVRLREEVCYAGF